MAFRDHSTLGRRLNFLVLTEYMIPKMPKKEGFDIFQRADTICKFTSNAS